MEELLVLIEPLLDELSLFAVGVGFGFTCNEIKKGSRADYIIKFNIILMTVIILILVLGRHTWN